METHRWEDLDARVIDCNDEGGCGCRAIRNVETWIGRLDKQADDGHATDVEEQQADIYASNSLGDIASRILHFRAGNL